MRQNPAAGVTNIRMEDSLAVARLKRRGPLPILYSVDRDTERTQTAEDPQCPVMMGAEDEYLPTRKRYGFTATSLPSFSPWKASFDPLTVALVPWTAVRPTKWKVCSAPSAVFTAKVLVAASTLFTVLRRR